ncbi:MAG: acid phosphatase [Marmoricola sp.]|nr:acid phosphatase [Marmoricola sp.]
MSRRLFTVALLATVLVLSVLALPGQAAAPGRKKWLKDTRSAMYGSRAYVRDRVAQGGTGLAVNLDIDNTSLATYYRRGKAVPVVLRFARYASSKGVRVLFNTGRNEKDLAQAVAGLRRAGFPVTAICGHRTGESLVAGKQRCRRQYVNAGYTIIANVGNRRTDFVGGDYERAFRLPNYRNRLG